MLLYVFLTVLDLPARFISVTLLVDKSLKMAAKLGDCRKLVSSRSYKVLVKVGPQRFFCSYLFYGTYFLAMLVGSVKNASLFQKFSLNLIGFRVCDLSEPIRCHSSLPVCLIET